MDEAANWLRMEDEGFFELIGPVFYQPSNGTSARFQFRAEPKHRNRNNVVHGGMLMAFADRGMGATSRQSAPARRQATIQLNVQFIREARIGDLVEMECRIVRETRSLVFIEGTITSGDDVVAKASGIWKLIDATPRS
jgi:uncharacterized protein (TIGR00369 family)